MNTIFIPADVPQHARETYLKNLTTLTKNTDRLFLFACDQKIEHLNDDFMNDNDSSLQDPHHIFSIASQAPIGALATHLGFIARYALEYSHINYVVKLNAKTNSHPTDNDPYTVPLYSVADVISFQSTSTVPIVGIGLTVYIGSSKESDMLAFAAQSILQAHQAGLIAIVWMYARGEAITDQTDPHLTAGLTGLADSLGADFVKIKPPHATGFISSAEHLKNAVASAGNTRVICAGGTSIPKEELLRNLDAQLRIGGTAGCAIGRNIFQHTLPEALTICKAIASLVYKKSSLKESLKIIS